MAADQIVFSLSPEEYGESAHLRKKTILRQNLYVAAVFVVFLFATSLAYLFHVVSEALFYLILFNVVVVSIVLLAMRLLKKYVLWPRACRKLLRENPMFHQDISFEWSDTGFALTNSHISNNFRWIDLLGFSEGKYIFGLYLSNTRVVIVPKRAFTEGARVGFSALLQGKLRVLT